MITHATFTPGNQTRTEAYLTQPLITAEAYRGALRARGTLDLEGLTLRRGELATGAWGEGFVDRRHPHTYAHELLVGAESEGSRGGASLFAGRGFVPFGSDDPMARPFVSYPVNHHLAQILERLEVVGAARAGAFALELATFNGDEPLDPSTPPLLRRFADSWAARGTFFIDEVLSHEVRDRLGRGELEVSYAAVKSPEYREGRGMDQRKWHASVRVANAGALWTRYALAEWARTDDLDRGRRLYTFQSLLGEAALCRGDVGLAARIERSDRPEEERLADLFRSPRPATDLSILGVTRWTTLSAAFAAPAAVLARTRFAPFLEGALIGVARVTAAVFNPSQFYGSNRMWRLASGVRVSAGHAHSRMGRYGAATTSARSDSGEFDHHSTEATHCFA
jgi:hypothetical protein